MPFSTSNSAASYPVALRLVDRRVVLAGGGRIAARRIPRLLASGARVCVIAPAIDAELRHWVDTGRIEWRQRRAEPADIDGAALLFAATNEAAANTALTAAARVRGVPVQRADDAVDSDFLVPAVIERGPMTIAVTSDGAAPSLTRRLRARLETLIPRSYGDLASLAAEFRDRVRARVPRSARGAFWQGVFDGPIAELVFSGRHALARRQLAKAVADYAPAAAVPRGEVYLVGSGPGNPDLLTFRALRLMQRADVVLYDSLLSADILDLVSPEAERIHVGKRAAQHTLAQPDINRLMIELAGRGRRVLRLKGGDPFVFGRGGEEIAELADAGIAFQIVPGITAANGCAAYAGIPLTHRDHAQSVIFCTGHLKNRELELSWSDLAHAGQTVVFFMARENLATICARLRAHGLPGDWPAAMVIDGTTQRQRVLAGTLANLPAQVAAEGSTGAALLIVGQVVALHQTLGWFAPGAKPAE